MVQKAGLDDFVLGVAVKMGVVGGAKAADDINNATKRIDRSLGKLRNSVNNHKNDLAELNRRYKEGAITKSEYAALFSKLKAREDRRIARLEKEKRAVAGLDKQESILNSKRRARIAGVAAAGVSGMGFGGRAAGAARFIGGGATLAAGAGLGLGLGTVSLIKESVTAFAELEAKVTGLKTLFGEPLGEKLATQFRSLAKTTILTNNQLIENAKTWASYGLTTEGLTDRLKRLGTVAGGNSEKFRALTIAFAQVNAQGKLMGQEKNQLINAGFSLQAVAEAAGISMEDFADSMKKGEIRAEHLNEALVKVTNEGGLFAGYLERQAETLEGKMIILSAVWEEFLQSLGRAEKGPASSFLDKLIYTAEILKEAAEYWGSITGASPVLGGATQAAKYRGDVSKRGRGLGEAGMEAFVDNFGMPPLDRTSEAQYISLIMRVGKVSQQRAKQIYDAEFANMVQQNKDNKNLHDYTMETLRIERETAEIENNAAKRRLNRQITRLRQGYYGLFEYQAMYEQTLGMENEEDLQEQMLEAWKAYLNQLADPFAPYRNEKDFVGPMPLTSSQREEYLAGLNAATQKEIDDLENKKRQAEDLHAFETAILKMKQDDLNKNLERERKLAQGPEQKDAYFEGGSVAEFMFLRRETQINETAKAIKEAEEKANAQRQALQTEQAAADQRRDTKIDNLTTAINTLTEKINTGD